MARDTGSFPGPPQRRSHRLQRIDTIASWALDTAIAAATLVPTVFVIAVERDEISGGAAAEIAIGAVLSVAPLVVRRRRPVGVLTFILFIGLLVPGPAVFSPPALLAVYTVASRRDRDLALGGGLATLCAFAAHRLIHGYVLPPVALVMMAALCALAVAAGLYQRTRLAYLDELADRAAVSNASGCCWPSRPSPTSACGWRGNCTTSSPTTSP